MKIKNILIGLGIITVMILSFLSFGKTENKPYVGGSFNPVIIDFAEGISVDGTTIINSAGQFVGSLATTLASTVGSVGAGANITVPVITPTTDTTLTVAQSGSIVNMGTAGLDITLPSVTSSAGVSYTFVVSGNFTTTDMTIVSGTADKLDGTLIVAGAVVDCDATDLITIVNDGENVGDFVELFSNGTNWLIGKSGALTASKMTCSG